MFQSTIQISNRNIGDLVRVTVDGIIYTGTLKTFSKENVVIVNAKDQETEVYDSLRLMIDEIQDAVSLEKKKVVNLSESPIKSTSGKQSEGMNRNNSAYAQSQSKPTPSSSYQRTQLPYGKRPVAVNKQTPLHLRQMVEPLRSNQYLYIKVRDELSSRERAPSRVLEEADLQVIHGICNRTGAANLEDCVPRYFVMLDQMSGKEMIKLVYNYLHTQPVLGICGFGCETNDELYILGFSTNHLVALIDADLLSTSCRQDLTRIMDKQPFALVTSPDFKRVAYDARWLTYVLHKQYGVEMGPTLDLQVLSHGLCSTNTPQKPSVLTLPQLICIHLAEAAFPYLLRAQNRIDDEAYWKQRPLCNTMLNQAFIYTRYLVPLYQEMIDYLLSPVHQATAERISAYAKTPDLRKQRLVNPISNVGLQPYSKFWIFRGKRMSLIHQQRHASLEKRHLFESDPATVSKTLPPESEGEEEEEIERVSGPNTSASEFEDDQQHHPSVVNFQRSSGVREAPLIETETGADAREHVGRATPDGGSGSDEQMSSRNSGSKSSLKSSQEPACIKTALSPSHVTSSSVPSHFVDRDGYISPTKMTPLPALSSGVTFYKTVLSDSEPTHTDECFSDIPLRPAKRLSSEQQENSEGLASLYSRSKGRGRMSSLKADSYALPGQLQSSFVRTPVNLPEGYRQTADASVEIPSSIPGRVEFAESMESPKKGLSSLSLSSYSGIMSLESNASSLNTSSDSIPSPFMGLGRGKPQKKKMSPALPGSMPLCALSVLPEAGPDSESLCSLSPTPSLASSTASFSFIGLGRGRPQSRQSSAGTVTPVGPASPQDASDLNFHRNLRAKRLEEALRCQEE